MSAKHTPEPWVLGRTSEDKRLILGGPDRRYVASVTIHQIPRHMGLHDEPEREANVSLILAAPELLEVAEEIASMADILRTGSHTPKMLNATRHKIMRDAANVADRARAAIARATGGES